jgi:glycosyltransferase involved in cell wall biosynthesis
MNAKPLVSILIPYYNDDKFLANAIESVLNQTYSNWELFLLNHASTDNSKTIARSYKDLRIKHIDMPYNIGGGGSILAEAFLKQATGKYIKFFCADDVMLDNCLEVMVDYMQNNPQIDFCFADIQYVDKDLNYYPDTWFGHRPDFNLNYTSKEILKCFFNLMGILPYPSSMVKRDKLNFKTNKTAIMSCDFSLWTNILINGGTCGLINKVLVLYRVHEGQTSYVGNEDKSRRLYMLEGVWFFEIFYKINDIALIKYLLDKSPYAQKLNAGDEKFIPFVLSHYYAYYGIIPPAQYLGRLKLTKILSDDNMRGLIKNAFGYTLKDFRQSLVDNPVILVKSQDLLPSTSNAYFNKDTIPFLKLLDLLRHRIHHELRKVLGIERKKANKTQKKPYSL